MTLGRTTPAVTLTAVCLDDDVRCFCARVERAVGPHGFELVRAFAIARQAWPADVGSVTGTATLVHCEFAPTQHHPSVDGDDDNERLLSALGFVEIFGVTRSDIPSPVPWRP